jgi:hypothetical protein
MKAPTLFATMYMSAAPQDAVLASMLKTGAIGRFWHPRTATIRIVQWDFGEFPFHELR